jgi:hypothetical protein
LQCRIKFKANAITDQFAIDKVLLAVIDNVHPDHFLETLTAVDQEKPKSGITPADFEQPKFNWISKNADFLQWMSASSAMLWLSGPPLSGIQQATVSIINLAEKEATGRYRSVLYVFCSTVTRARSAVTGFVGVLLHQIASHLPVPNKKTVITVFLFFLLEAVLSRDPSFHSNLRRDKNNDLIKVLLDLTSDSEHMNALQAAIQIVQEQELLIIICGLDEVEKGFIRRVYAFVAYLKERTSNVKVLITSGLEDEIKALFKEIPSIEYDKERKGSIGIHFETYWIGLTNDGCRMSQFSALR